MTIKPIRNDDDLVASLFEVQTQRARDVRFIFYDQDFVCQD